MKKKNNEIPLPLRLVKELGDRFPGAFDKIDEMRAEPSLEWNKEKCYIPLAATIPIVDNYIVKKDPSTDPSALAALSAWRQYKEIYHFDGELASELYQQANELEDIPVAVLDALPYPCLFIELEDDVFQGFFVWWEQDFDFDVDTQEYEMRFLTVGNPDGGLAIYHLHICEGGTLEESTERTAARMKRGFRMSNKKINDEYLDNIAQLQSQVVARLLQLVLYICAENADVSENPEQRKITRKPSAGMPPKDVFREIRKWDVGVKIGKMIRQQKYYGSGASGHSGASRRPHVRRGHYHHFWVGSEKDGTRRLILRWIAPTFVNGSADDVVVTRNIL